MVRILIIVFVLIGFNGKSYSQTTFPKGIYMNMDELVRKTPSSNKNLSVERRTTGQIKMTGGNDYKITSEDKSFSNKKIRKNVLAYSNGDTLFINGYRYKIQDEFAQILNNGKYLMFVGGISSDPDLHNYQMEQSKTSSFWGNLGGIGGGIQGAKTAVLRFPYLINTQKNSLIFLNNDSLRKLLAEKDLELLKQYDLEKKKLNDKEGAKKTLIIKYITILNS